jgi:hypothetical protein
MYPMFLMMESLISKLNTVPNEQLSCYLIDQSGGSKDKNGEIDDLLPGDNDVKIITRCTKQKVSTHQMSKDI